MFDSYCTTFFLYGSGAPRNLHSFPTRRSSDLRAQPGVTNVRASDSELRFTADEPVVARSEEHTSELQSPYDLVCRLLLEKKKQTSPTPPSSCYDNRDSRLCPRRSR